MAIHKAVAKKTYLSEEALSKLKLQVDLIQTESLAREMEARVNVLNQFGLVGFGAIYEFKNTVNFVLKSGLGKELEYSYECKMIWTRSLEPGVARIFRNQIKVD